MSADTKLFDWLASLVIEFQQNPDFRPTQIDGPFGSHGCMYDNDDYDGGGEYVTIGFNMPEHVFAEVEDGTYGTLQGWRIYIDPADQGES